MQQEINKILSMGFIPTHIQNKHSFAQIDDNEAVLVTEALSQSIKVQTQVVDESVSIALILNSRPLFSGLSDDLELAMEAITAMIQMREDEQSTAFLDHLPQTDYGRALRKFLTA